MESLPIVLQDFVHYSYTFIISSPQSKFFFVQGIFQIKSKNAALSWFCPILDFNKSDNSELIKLYLFFEKILTIVDLDLKKNFADTWTYKIFQNL